MNDDTPISSEIYEGPDPKVAALGYAKVYGWAGTVGGALVGAGVGAVANPWISKHFGKWIERATKMLEKANLPHDGKAAVIGGAALLGSFVAHYGAFAFGYFTQGLSQSRRGKAQFEQVKAERDAARGKLAELTAETQGHAAKQAASSPAQSFAESHKNRGEHGSHVAKAEHDKAQADAAELGR